LQYLVILTWTIISLEVGFMIVKKVRMNKYCKNQRLKANAVFVFDLVIPLKDLKKKSGGEMASHLAVQADHKYQVQLRTDPESKPLGDSNSNKHEQNIPSLKNKRTLPSQRVNCLAKRTG